jgi:flagellar biosynthesis component FlhA
MISDFPIYIYIDVTICISFRYIYIITRNIIYIYKTLERFVIYIYTHFYSTCICVNIVLYIYIHRVAIYTELHHSFRHFPTNYIGLCLITRLDLVTGLGKCPSIVGSLPHSFFSGYISLSFLVIPPFFRSFPRSITIYHLVGGFKHF